MDEIEFNIRKNRLKHLYHNQVIEFVLICLLSALIIILGISWIPCITFGLSMLYISTKDEKDLFIIIIYIYTIFFYMFMSGFGIYYFIKQTKKTTFQIYENLKKAKKEYDDFIVGE